MKEPAGENWMKMHFPAQIEGVRTNAAKFVEARIVPRHLHHDYVFGFAIEGAWEIDCGHCGGQHIFQKGDLLLTEAHEVYAGRSLGEPPWRSLGISVSGRKLAALLAHTTDGEELILPHFTRAAVNDPTLRRLFLGLYETLGELPCTTLLEQESRLLDWTAALRNNYASRSKSLKTRRIYRETRAVRRVREFITENFAANIKLTELAEIGGLSMYHLNRAFAAQVGLPPHEFQNQLRIERAGKLLARKKSFAEIAFETGFSDQSHFTRFFKRYMGVTPKKFFAG